MKRAVILIAAVASCAWFLWEVTSRGWSRPSSDFPNYYTAAKLARAHQPLRRYYEWKWFQRQLDLAGIDQLGGFIPQPPLVMAPFVPLSFFSLRTARRIWFVLNLGFLAAALWLLSRMTTFTLAELWLLAFLGFNTLRTNFELGQYYVFLLAVLTLAAWCLLRKREGTGGALIGAAVALKLYGAPLLLLALCRRRGRAAAGIVTAFLLVVSCAIAIFGRSDMWFYAAQVLPRALRGETPNPYHPANGTAATLLRRLFVGEAELNPHPLSDSPAAFLFATTLFSLSVMMLPCIAAVRSTGAPAKRTLAWWLLGMLLVSPYTASYTYTLSILPVALLLEELSRGKRVLVLSAYFLLTLPLWPAWSWVFPKVWLLLVLFLLAGYPEIKSIPWKAAGFAFAAALLVSGAVAAVEPGYSRDIHREVTEPGAIYSSSPSVSRAGLLYESIGKQRYVLRRGDRTFSFDGDAFHPATPDSGSPIYFELVARRHSEIVSFDEATGQLETLPVQVSNPEEPAVSHDGRTVAVIGGNALYVGGKRLTAPAHDPSFVPGDRAIVFTSGSSIREIALDSGSVTMLVAGSADLATPSLSADGRRLLFAARSGANWQVWVKDLTSGAQTRVTGGNCNNFTPVWDQSGEIVFASDCRRSVGLPALFRSALK